MARASEPKHAGALAARGARLRDCLNLAAADRHRNALLRISAEPHMIRMITVRNAVADRVDTHAPTGEV